MKAFFTLAIAFPIVTFLLVAGGLGGGCASSSGGSSAPKPGSGIAEFREVTREAHRAVATTVKSLEALAQSNTPASLQHPALPAFDRAFHQLELTSVQARARAEALVARGEAYFDEWRGILAVETNQPPARAETERFNRLYDQFERVRLRSGEVREEFRPFMAKLREFRARLDKPAGDSRPNLEELTAGGRRVLQQLEAVTSALNAADAELRVTLATKQ